MKQMRWFAPLIVLMMISPWIRIASAHPQAAAGQEVHSDLPPGPGREKFQRICSSCHVVTVVTTQRKSADDWAGVVDDMRSRGANGSDEDFDQIVKYLAANFGPVASGHVNINTAGADEIVSALAMTKTEADAIVSYRTAKGPFKDLDAVKKVPGIDPAKVEASKDRIDF